MLSRVTRDEGIRTLPIQVIGAGGIGGAVGYALLQAGRPVTFVETDARKIAAGRERGVQVDGRSALRAEYVCFDDWRPIPESWVLLCTKCYDNAAVLDRLTVPVRLLPIQNGFDTRVESFGHEFEGIASFVARAEPCESTVRITRSGDLHLGRKGDGATADAEFQTLAESMNASGLFRVKVVPRIDPYKYAKLMYNAAISPLAAAAGFDNGKLLSLPAARRLFFALIQENHRILTAGGIPLGKVGPFHPGTVAWILRRRRLATMMAAVFEPSLRGTYCSMAGEIQKGRTELDNYNGRLLQLADQTGTPAPFNRAVYELVAGMTAARANPNPEVVERLGSQTAGDELRAASAELLQS